MYDGLFYQVESITSLLVGLTSRLARAETEAGAARTEADFQSFYITVSVAGGEYHELINGTDQLTGLG
jgi:hypothetical protein